MKSEDTKKHIIDTTIKLIKESSGDVSSITIRKICTEANIGTGLINHYFGSKDKLIEVCVQTIITGVVTSFKPLTEGKSQLEILSSNAKAVMDFLIDNKEISQISITGDMMSPKADDNTMKTVMGFSRNVENNDGNLLSIFMMTSLIQTFFLRRDVLQESFGIDFYDKTQRDKVIDLIVERVVAL